jgi:hypothetical protein
MKFIVVNGRTPKPIARCALCCTSITESYVRDLASGYSYCDHACYAADREELRAAERRKRRVS